MVSALARKYRDFFNVHMQAQLGAFGLMLAFYAAAKFLLEQGQTYSELYQIAAIMNLYLYDYMFVIIACTTAAIFLGRLGMVEGRIAVHGGLAVAALVILTAILSAHYLNFPRINFGITYSWIRFGMAFGGCYVALACDMVACWILHHKHLRN